MNNEEIIQKAEELFSSEGFTFAQLVRAIGKKKSSLLDMSETDFIQYSTLFQQIACKDELSRKDGKLLEQLSASLLFNGTNQLFECIRNARTSTNEIDILVRWSDAARMADLPSAFPIFKDSFLCECKHYDKKVDVTYVGKFANLLQVSNKALGILFTIHGVTARSSWSDAVGLIKKIALRQKIYIITFDLEDYRTIYKRQENFFSLASKKYEALSTDINYEKYLSCHELEEHFS
jgi:hypothetical protein